MSVFFLFFFQWKLFGVVVFFGTHLNFKFFCVLILYIWMDYVYINDYFSLKGAWNDTPKIPHWSRRKYYRYFFHSQVSWNVHKQMGISIREKFLFLFSLLLLIRKQKHRLFIAKQLFASVRVFQKKLKAVAHPKFKNETKICSWNFSTF